MMVIDFPPEERRSVEAAERCLEKLLEEVRTLRGTPHELVAISYVVLYRDMTSKWGSSVSAKRIDSAEVISIGLPPQGL